VEVGVQMARSFEAAGRVVPSTLPAVEAATTVHAGTPAEIGAAHHAVRAWCSAQHRELTGVSWEIYGDPDPQTGHFDVVGYWQLAQPGGDPAYGVRAFNASAALLSIWSDGSGSSTARAMEIAPTRTLRARTAPGHQTHK
jgi:hypothetical protein